MEFITINKIVERKDGTLGIESDVIRIDDIKSFRNWYKRGVDESVPGPMCQVLVKSESAKEGFFPIKINETEKSFSDRLGIVIPIHG